MAKKMSTEDTISALSKLSKKDKFILITVSAVIVISVIMFLFKLATGQYESVENRFPDSTLADTPVYQSYQFKRTEELTVPISFPSIPYGMFVAGEEAFVQEDGCSFSYSDNVSIVVVEAMEGMDTSSIIKDKLYMYLYGRNANTRVKYKAVVSDTGYMNGLYASYECGVYTVAGLERYLLSYRYFTGAGKDILFMVVTEDSQWLLSMKNLLDTMFYTMYTFDPADGSAVILENSKQEPLPDTEEPIQEDAGKENTEDISEDISSSYMEYEGPISEKAKEQLERIRILREEQAKKAQEGYLDGYGSTEFYASYVYEGSLTDACFIFHYGEVYKTPGYAYLYDPDGNQYEPDSINKALSGDIVFMVKDPMPGQWSFVVEDKDGLGGCTVDAVDATAYEALQQPFNEEERSAPPAD